jgi:hypothetical protein
VSKRFYKKIDKNPKPICSRFCLARFWAFLGEGSLKNTIKLLTQKSYQPWYFLGLRGINQPPQGPSTFFFSAPWGLLSCFFVEIVSRPADLDFDWTARPPQPASESRGGCGWGFGAGLLKRSSKHKLR